MLKFFGLYIYVTHRSLNTVRYSGLVYVTNATIETRMCAKVGVSFRESSFHLSEQLFTAEKKSRRTTREVLQTFC